MRIFVLRHGETKANSHGFFQGQTDCGLLDSGKELAKEVGRALRGTTFDAAFSSPLPRAVETAGLVLLESGNANIPLQLDDRLLEINMGDWEGLRFLPEEREVDAIESALFFEDPFVFSGFPGGEDARTVCERTQEFLIEVATMDYETVLVSTHGFALRAMLNFLYDDQDDFWQGGVPLNCTINIVESNGNRLELVTKDLILYDRNLCVDRYARY